MIALDEKLNQVSRIATLTNELVEMCVRKSINRHEAKASLKAAIEIVSTFPASAYERIEENA
ncbi:MAG: hypothetical protein ABSF98_04765 [Bryobacteraceae bacterium]|jgi:hypothetical protein